MFFCLSFLFVHGKPSGLGHYEFIAHLLQAGALQDSNKLLPRLYKNADKQKIARTFW